MLKRHLAAIAAIDATPALAYRIRRYFALGRRPLIIECPRAGLSQADIVLALLRIGTPRSRSIVETLINKPITIAPACKLTWAYNKQSPTVGTQPVIVKVSEHVPLRKGTRLALSFPEFKCGRTKSQLLQRGVSNGDIRRAIKRGWIVMTEAK